MKRGRYCEKYRPSFGTFCPKLFRLFLPVRLQFRKNHNRNSDKKQNDTQRKEPADIIQF